MTDLGNELVTDGGITVSTGPDTGPSLDFDADPEDTDRREIHLDGSLVLVGCGKAKRDPTDGGHS